MLSRFKRWLRVRLGGKLEEEVLDEVNKAVAINHALNVALATARREADANYQNGLALIAALVLHNGGEVTLSEDILNAVDYRTQVIYNNHPDGSTTIKIATKEEEKEQTEETEEKDGEEDE